MPHPVIGHKRHAWSQRVNGGNSNYVTSHPIQNRYAKGEVSLSDGMYHCCPRRDLRAVDRECPPEKESRATHYGLRAQPETCARPPLPAESLSVLHDCWNSQRLVNTEPDSEIVAKLLHQLCLGPDCTKRLQHKRAKQPGCCPQVCRAVAAIKMTRNFRPSSREAIITIRPS
jgi:hypothetical protein